MDSRANAALVHTAGSAPDVMTVMMMMMMT